jgi:glucokinase
VSADLIGVNIGGTTTSIVAAHDDARIAARRAWPTRSERGAEIYFAEIVQTIRALAPSPRAIGVSIGGPLDAHRGVLHQPPHLPGLEGFPFLERLRELFEAPLVLHHDAAACALAEWRWGSEAHAAGVAYLTCGTGFGCGLVLDGRVRYGSTGHSPEIGHIRFRESGPTIFEKPGCYEGYGSAKALALLARDRDPQRFAGAAPAEIVASAEAGDAVAREAVAANIEAVGSACALLADLLVLDTIVLGSLATYLGEPWIAAVREVFRREALPANVAHCIVRGPSIDAIQDRGALAAAFEALERSNTFA